MYGCKRKDFRKYSNHKITMKRRKVWCVKINENQPNAYSEPWQRSRPLSLLSDGDSKADRGMGTLYNEEGAVSGGLVVAGAGLPERLAACVFGFRLVFS